MAEGVESKKPLQQGVESNLLDYYDIMVIGKTGMGKSTTVDKMLIAKLRDARENYPASQQVQSESIYDSTNHKLVCDDLTMWLVSDTPSDPEQDCHDDNLEKMTLRLKNLVFFRSLENSHLEINDARETDMSIYKSTLKCELLSNESTKVRVLDVPGFFGREASGDMETPEERLKKSAQSALSNMRKVLRIKNAHNLKFRRVVYFLPEKGALKRTSQNLIAELQVMEQYFGQAIFDSMVVIATMPSEVFEHVSAQTIIFSEKHFRQTNDHLQEALKVAFNSKNVPEPPIKFISLLDTCEEVLHKVQGAEVLKESINLEFRSSICARCGLKVIEEGKLESESVYCTSPDRMGSIAYEESTCHPMMIPKYSNVEKVLGGLLHLVTFRRFVGKWPNFESMDEFCIECKQPPLSSGCRKIGTKYPGANKDSIVRHSSSAVEPYVIVIEGEEIVPANQGVGTGIPVGVGPGFSLGGGADSIHQESFQYVSQDGRHVFKKEASQLDSNFDVKC